MPDTSARPRPVTRTAVRHGRQRRSSGWKGALSALAGVLTVAVVGGGGVAAYAYFDLAGDMRPPVELVGAAGERVPDIDAIDGGVNLLLVGSDSRAGQDPVFGGEAETGTLNDVTMLLHIAQDHSSATVVSFPRDMFVAIPACPQEDGVSRYPARAAQKINTTLSTGGLACTVATVEKLTGLQIPFAAEVQFGGVIELSNAIGGVEVCVAQGIRDPYTGLDLPAGANNLQGMEALQFLRTRHGVGDGSDLGRISNQQVFLSALARKLQDGGTLSDPATLYGIAKAALGNMRLSSNLAEVNTMVSIAMALKDIPRDRILFVQYPNEIGSIAGSEGVLPLRVEAEQLMAALRADQAIALTGGSGVGAVAEPGADPADPAAPNLQDPADPGMDVSAAPEDPASPIPPGATAPPATGLVLPGTVFGQTAGDVTCSAGNAR